MKDWLLTYGWKFLLALIVVGLAMWFLVHLDRKAHGRAAAPAPQVALIAAPRW